MKSLLRTINFIFWIVIGYAILSPAGTWMPEPPSLRGVLICCFIALVMAWIDNKIWRMGGPKGPNRLA